MDADELVKKYEIEAGKNYLLIIKVKSLDDSDNIRGLDKAIAAINSQLNTNMIGIIVSEESEFRLINVEDMSIEQAVQDMGLVKKELKNEDEEEL